MGPSLIAIVKVPTWSTEPGCLLWARHAVIRTDPAGKGVTGLLCYGAQPVVIFPLLWAVALRRCLRAASVPGCATATERVIATAFVALCARMTLQQVEGRSPWLTVSDAPAGAMVQLTDQSWSPADFSATCVYAWQGATTSWVRAPVTEGPSASGWAARVLTSPPAEGAHAVHASVRGDYVYPDVMQGAAGTVCIDGVFLTRDPRVRPHVVVLADSFEVPGAPPRGCVASGPTSPPAEGVQAAHASFGAGSGLRVKQRRASIVCHRQGCFLQPSVFGHTVLFLQAKAALRLRGHHQGCREPVGPLHHQRKVRKWRMLRSVWGGNTLYRHDLTGRHMSAGARPVVWGVHNVVMDGQQCVCQRLHCNHSGACGYCHRSVWDTGATGGSGSHLG